MVGVDNLISRMIGAKIKEARLEKGMSIEGLSDQTGIGRSVLECYENKGILLNMDHLLLISKALDKSLSYFLGGQITDQEQQEPWVLDSTLYDQAVSIPVIKRFYGNEQLLMDENILGYEFISQELGKTIHFASQVHHSVEFEGEIRANPGDFLLWEQKRWPDKNGQLVAVVLDESASLRWFYQNEITSAVELKAVHNEEKDVLLYPDEVVIISVCVGRMLKLDE
jgi:transcriptional regulator with XRE-family HTH domain